MNAANRQLFAVFLIVVAVCIGGYEMFAAPANERLANAEQRADSLRQRIVDVDRAAKAAPVLHQRVDQCSRAAEAIRQLGRAAQDEAALFASIESIAAEYRVVVERISPSRTRASAARTAGAEPARDRAVGIELAVRAKYADLVRCVDALHHGLGLCRIEAIALTPDPNGGVGGVTASIRMTTFAIDPEPAITPPGEQQGGRT